MLVVDKQQSSKHSYKKALLHLDQNSRACSNSRTMCGAAGASAPRSEGSNSSKTMSSLQCDCARLRTEEGQIKVTTCIVTMIGNTIRRASEQGKVTAFATGGPGGPQLMPSIHLKPTDPQAHC